MRTVIALLLFSGYQMVFAQGNPKPFSESDKAISALSKEPFVYDSLRKVYKGRLTLNFTYGQRFLLSSDISELPDTVTNADFTDRRSLYGMGLSYFFRDRWSVGLEFSFAILPTRQEIDFSTFEGSGSGGVAITMGITTRYYFRKEEFFRPYVGLHVGTTNLTAAGGEGGLRTGQTRVKLEARLRTTQLTAGFGYRVSPGLVLDYNIGLSKTSSTELIGGVTSYGGITTALTMQFVLNHNNN